MNTLQHACLTTTSGKEFILERIRMTGDVRGLMLDMQVTQEFCNHLSSHTEVIYTFPLPWGAVLLSVEVTLGDKKLTGMVVGKKQAEAEYEGALSSGDTAIMLEKNSDDSYSLNLGNLAPKERCSIFIRYAQTLQFEQHGLRLLIPTVIAPRYDGSQAYVPKRSDIPEHLIPRHTLAADYPFDIEVRLHDVLAQARIASPSHLVALKHQDGTAYVSLSRQGTLDRDFVLVLDQLSANAVVATGPDYLNPERQVMLASFYPQITQNTDTHISVKILVDCSGSMAGDSMAAARRSLKTIVDNLTEGDHFSLSRFGTHAEHRSRAMWKSAPASKAAAQQWIERLEADLGGTEMEAALSSTFKLNEKVRSDVLMITDGDITDIQSVILAAEKSGHRLFIVGVGNSPAESHLRRLADATKGACDFVATSEAVEPAVLRMFNRLRSPHVDNVRCVWPENCTPVWTSESTSSVFEGDTYHVFALFEQKPEGVIRLQGQRAGSTSVDELGTIDLSSATTSDHQLSRVAANARLNASSLIGPNSTEAEKIALDYQLVTEQTNFLLIHERPESEKASDMPALYQVKHMIPAGHSGMGQTRLRTIDPLVFDSASCKPAVYRMATSSDRIRLASSSDRVENGMEMYDIPAFLRKKPDDVVTAPESVDEDDAVAGSTLQGKEKLSPLGLLTLLDTTPERNWPICFDDLRHIDLSESLIEWLEFVVMPEFPWATESIVVASFIRAVASMNVCRVMPEQAKKKADTRSIFKRFFKKNEQLLPQNISPDVDMKIVGEIQLLLKGAKPQQWPVEFNDFVDD
ncbi:VIT and vWA domain-containing protein [Undibacterium sp. WLX3042]|uniref:VIT and vWA domain-containing protein n=1 Tax=Undibacterium sp. WLX3042 TaxID=3412686 RepID=UPI003C2C5757